jgi:ABC-type lipoprotein export system ATPase subunit
MSYPRGSEWRLWDLHCHTPESFDWKGESVAPEKLAEAVIAAMKKTGVHVFAIQDHWTFAGYEAVAKHLSAYPEALGERQVFPGIELRVEAPVDYLLNIHVLFPEQTPVHRLNTFLGKLRLSNKQPPTRENMIAFARALDEAKLKLHGASDADRENPEKMLYVAYQTAKVSRESLWEALDETFGKTEYLVLMPWSTSNGLEKLDWKKHVSDIDVFMKRSHMFETRTLSFSELFRGIRTAKNEGFIDTFTRALGGRPKPVYAGTDAHSFKDYGRYPSDRKTWIKADPTFAGLRQTLIEPAERVFIGAEPDKLASVRLNPTKYVSRITISRNPQSTLGEKWFNVDLPLNHGLIAVVGNKGSGKTGLVDALALVANADCPELPFLSETRFRSPPNRAAHFTAELTWADDTRDRRNLSTARDLSAPPRIKYLAQDQIETLCNEISREGRGSQFEAELRKVILSHLPEHERLDATTLDGVLDAKTGPYWSEIRQLRVELADISRRIESYDTDLDPAFALKLRQELQLREAELAALEAKKPVQLAPPTGSSPEMEQASAKLKELLQQQINLDQRRATLLARQKELATKRADILTVETEIRALQKHIHQVEERIAATASRWQMDLKVILTVQIREDLLHAELRSVIEESANVDAQLTSKAGGINSLLAHVADEIRTVRGAMEGPAKAYAESMHLLDEWNAKRAAIIGRPGALGTIEHLRAEVRRVAETVPAERKAAWKELENVAGTILSKVEAIVKIHQELFSPVQRFVEQTEVSASLNLRFDIRTKPEEFAERFFAIVSQQKRGSFYGTEQGRARLDSLLGKRTFDDGKDSLAFANDVYGSLERDGEAVRSPREQLRKAQSLSGLLQFIFGFEYLQPHYTLTLDGKAIELLSPGEKGALLIVFYLLLDPDNIPLVVDQPEHNLDNESVYRLLVPCFRMARSRRQVVLVTHNPNLAVVCDAEQVIHAHIDKADGNRIDYTSGAIENPRVNELVVNVLEGTWPAFDNRGSKYQAP